MYHKEFYHTILHNKLVLEPMTSNLNLQYLYNKTSSVTATSRSSYQAPICGEERRDCEEVAEQSALSQVP